VNLPCLGYIPPSRLRGASGGEDDSVLVRSTFYGHFQSERIIHLTEEARTSFVDVPGHVRRLADIGLVRDQDNDQATMEAALREAVAEFLANGPEDDTEDGPRQQIARESAIIWVWDDSTEINFDELVVRHLHADEVPEVEALLDRPLLGVPCVAERMYGRMGLCSMVRGSK
jgi:hypothetical protein